jgi:indole-3-glycerol phosphate synthase
LGFLTEMVERVRRDLRDRPLAPGNLLLRTRALPPPGDFEAALRTPDVSLIAEVKRASPSAGDIAEVDAGSQAEAYQAAGASAVSVLTEPRHFNGSLADLRAVRRRCTLPLLRKDFLVHPSQIIESRAEGADAVLLISAALSPAELEELRLAAEEMGMAALVEVHSEEDLNQAVASGARVVGVNARDLETLEVDTEGALTLAQRVPPNLLVVIESGIRTRQQVERAAAAGAHAVLVGESLMRAADPMAAVQELLGR